MKITRNFDSSEFNASGVPWPIDKAANRQHLAELLQWMRDLAGVPGRITSAYRSPAKNAEVGGTESSQHMKAEAVDVVFMLCPIGVLAKRVLEEVRAGRAPRFGQIIFYQDKGHVHVSLPYLGNRNGEIRQSLVVDGERIYPILADARAIPTLSTAQKRAGIALPVIVAAIGIGLMLMGRPSA